MKKTIVFSFLFLFVFFSLENFSFGLNITPKLKTAPFVVSQNDIKDIKIELDCLTVEKYGRRPKSCFDSDTTSCTVVAWYKVDIYLKDECVARITNMDWTGDSYMLIEGCEYKMYAVRLIENLWLFDRPFLYNLSDDEKKFIIRDNVLGFSFTEDFVQEQPCFLNNLLSIKCAIERTPSD